jgi:hypothetical protein
MARPRFRAPTVPILFAAWTSETSFKAVMHLNCFVRMFSMSLSLAFAHTGPTVPHTAKRQIANLPIQVPPKEFLMTLIFHPLNIVERLDTQSFGLNGRLQTNCPHGL